MRGKAKLNKKSLSLKQEFIRSWWILAFLLFSYVIYVQATLPFQFTYEELQRSKISLEQKKENLEISIKNLKQTVASQDDSSWVELVLEKKLNRVPENQTKIIFSSDKESIK